MNMSIFSKLKRMRVNGTASFERHEHGEVLEAMSKVFHTGAVFEIKSYHGHQASDTLWVKRINRTTY